MDKSQADKLTSLKEEKKLKSLRKNKINKTKR